MITRTHFPPYPKGWYGLAISSDIPSGKLISRKLMEHELIIFRTKSGVLSALDAYCPHLGAHLGHGGKVIGEVVQCPFHRFCFDTQGKCASSAFKGGRAATWPIRETSGLVMVYYGGPENEMPTWEVPTLNTEGWSPNICQTFTFRSHPQEVVENSIDLSHGVGLHGFKSITPKTELKLEGPNLRIDLAVKESLDFPGFRDISGEVEFNVHAWGLGYLLIRVLAEDVKLDMRYWLLATPTEGENIELRLVFSADQNFNIAKMFPVLKILPASLLRKGLFALLLRKYIVTLKQDFVIWGNKNYVKNPIPAGNDPFLKQYREWAKQFYAAETST